MVFLGFFVCGTIVCAQGQMLLAALDSAVNNSPFLDNPQRASIMSLSATMTSGSHRSHAEAKSAAQKAVDDATFF
jgi:hypothetical protein